MSAPPPMGMTERHPERCYWYRDGHGETLIPMCIGCAVGGPAECTCDVPRSRIEVAEHGRAEAERMVLRLQDARDRRLEEQRLAWSQIKYLRSRIRELERRQPAKEDEG